MRIKAIAFVTIALLTASAAVAAAQPYSVCETRLGADWHCSRTMVVVTTLPALLKRWAGKQNPAGLNRRGRSAGWREATDERSAAR
jgi:hypothetical protein